MKQKKLILNIEYYKDRVNADSNIKREEKETVKLFYEFIKKTKNLTKK